MRIDRSIEIARPIADVFAFVSNPRNDVQWCPKVLSVEPLGSAGPGPGARYAVVHRPVPLLKARRMDYELVAWDPPHRVEWREDDGHDVIAVTYVLEAQARATRFTQHDEAELGAPRLLHPLIRAGIRRDLGEQLERLRVLLERD
jgi:hypothetical protein